MTNTLFGANFHFLTFVGSSLQKGKTQHTFYNIFRISLLLNIPMCLHFAMLAFQLYTGQDTFMMRTLNNVSKAEIPKDKKRTIGIPLFGVSPHHNAFAASWYCK